jgi:phage terminase large subunit
VNTVVWYGQFVGPEIRIVDCDTDLDLTPVQRVAAMLRKGYVFGDHFLPHDAMATQKSGITFQAELVAAGLSSVRIVPRTDDIWVGINRLRQLMPRMTFRIPACDSGLEALSNYHTRRESSGGIACDVPVHDWSSHASDGLRTLAEAEMAGMIRGGSEIARMARGGGKPRVITGIRETFMDLKPRPRVLM